LSVAGLKFLLFDERVSVAIPAAERPQEVEENVAGSGDAPFPASLRRKILSL
jgi:aryl-alcohol dehydrogenase-like predicted oxidoreductase